MEGRRIEEIDRIAEGWRKALDPEDKWAPEIMPLLEKAGGEFEAVRGLQVIFEPDGEMGSNEARAEFNPPCIYVRQSLENDAFNNAPRLRSTLAHELGHLILHPGVPKFRTVSSDKLAGFRVQEGEAWEFARAFLMPSWKVQRVTSPLDLSLRCRVSLEIAEIRHAQFVHGKHGRAEVPGVRDAINCLKSVRVPRAEDAGIAAERERAKAWERALHVPDEDPSRVRRSEDGNYGYRIERDQYEKPNSPFGWYVRDGKAFAYAAKESSE